MMGAASAISSFLSILLILGLNTDQATAGNYVENIGKLVALIKNYHRGYNYYRQSRFWTRKRDPWKEYTPLEHEFGYISAQARYATNFSDLNSIFVTQTLAMIYAVKLRARSYEKTKSSATRNTQSQVMVYQFFAEFGARSKSVVPVILNILKIKYPRSYKEFEHISRVFEDLRSKVNRQFFFPSFQNKEEEDIFLKELHDDTETMVKYIRTTFLQATDEESTGLGIDGDTDIPNLTFDVHSLVQVVKENPDMMYSNFDDKTKENMFRSTAMKLFAYLLSEISYAISPQTREEVGNLVIDSFVHVRKEKTTKALIFVEIPYTQLLNILPETTDPDNSKKSESIELPSSSDSQSKKNE